MKHIFCKQGMWLTQVTINNEDSRLFLSEILTSKPSMWRDATQEEKDTWEKEHQPEEPPIDEQ